MFDSTVIAKGIIIAMFMLGGILLVYFISNCDEECKADRIIEVLNEEKQQALYEYVRERLKDENITCEELQEIRIDSIQKSYPDKPLKYWSDTNKAKALYNALDCGTVWD